MGMDCIICVPCGLAFDIESGKKSDFKRWVVEHSHNQTKKNLLLKKGYGKSDIVEAGPLVYAHTLFEWEWCGLINMQHPNGVWHYHDDINEIVCSDPPKNRIEKDHLPINRKLHKVESEKHFLDQISKYKDCPVDMKYIEKRIKILDKLIGELTPKAWAEMALYMPKIAKEMMKRK